MLGLTRETSGGTATTYVRDPQGKLVSMRRGSVAHYYLFDGLGSVVGLTDSSGGLVDGKYRYDPFGKQLRAPDFPNPWRYVSGYYDSATGFTKFGTRYYDPDTMRWTQQDPVAGKLGDPISLNRYVYAGCNPVNYVDPTGRSGECALFNVIGGIAFLVTVGSAAVAYNFPPSAPASVLVSIVSGVFSVIAFVGGYQVCVRPEIEDPGYLPYGGGA